MAAKSNDVKELSTMNAENPLLSESIVDPRRADEDLSEQYMLYLRTVQGSIFRMLIEALKDVLPDTNMEFSMNGIKFTTMDSTHTALIHMKLEAKNFEEFFCVKPMTLGINIAHLFKLIKTTHNNDTLSLYIMNDDPNRLYITNKHGNQDKITNFKMNLLNVEDDDMDVPSIKFSSVIKMPTADLHTVFRDMSSISDYVEIKSLSKQLIFSCSGEYSEQEIILNENDENGMTYVNDPGEYTVVQGRFCLKFLDQFTKCGNMCNTLQLYMENGCPLIIVYQVGHLGQLKFGLSHNVLDA